MKLEFETVVCTIEDHIATITLNAPPFNLLGNPMLRDLIKLMGELESNKDVWCAILTGEGQKAFCAGADVGELTDPTVDELQASDVWARNAITRFSRLSFPVIAAINGFALGGGLELALACDIRLASQTAKVGLVETKIGLIAGWGGSQRLARTVGVGAAKMMMFTAEKLTAEDALKIGLVQGVYEAEELMDGAMAIAKKITSNSPVSNRLTKTAVNYFMNMGIAEGLDLESDLDRAAYLSEDSIEGMKAFEERRPANFKNQ